MMNGKKGISIAAGILLAVMAILLFVLVGFRGDVATVEAAQGKADDEIVRIERQHGERLAVVETDITHIRDDQSEMKTDIKAIRAAVE